MFVNFSMQIILLYIFCTALLFGDHKSQATFLLISPGAISQGMGEAMVAYSESSYMSYYNPAAMSFSSRNRFSFTHVNWLPNLAADLYHEFIAFNYRLNDDLAIGGHYIYLNLGEQIGMDGFGNPTSSWNRYMSAISLSFAYRLTNYSSIGLTAKNYKNNHEYYGYTGTAFDLSYFRQKNRLSIGLQIANISSEHTAPKNFRFGSMYKVFHNGHNIINLSFQSEKYLPRRHPVVFQNEFIYKCGMEYNYSEKYFLRAGYIYDNPSVMNPAYPTYGWGIHLWQLGFDFAYTGGEQGHPRTSTMYFSFSFQ